MRLFAPPKRVNWFAMPFSLAFKTGAAPRSGPWNIGPQMVGMFAGRGRIEQFSGPQSVGMFSGDGFVDHFAGPQKIGMFAGKGKVNLD